MTIKDSAERYGKVSRVLHWGMALLILWQFLSAISHYFFEDTAFEAFFWPSHKTLGVILLLLMLIRLFWSLMNYSNRPQSVSLISKLGHMALYMLLMVVPLVALIRQYGSGRTFDVLGLSIFSGFEGEKIQWMLDLGSDFHGELGWILLGLIVGHILMTFVHKKSSSKKDVLPRMWR